MNDNNRRYFSPEQKVAILREHLIEGKAVSDLCDKRHIHPTVFCEWQRQFFENGTTAFESKQSRSRVSDGYQKKPEALKQKIQLKNEVLSELLEGQCCNFGGWADGSNGTNMERVPYWFRYSRQPY